jgi:hypothetical protein
LIDSGAPKGTRGKLQRRQPAPAKRECAVTNAAKDVPGTQWNALSAPEFHATRAFSGKVETGFPVRKCDQRKKLEHIQFPWKLNVL